MGVPHLRNCKNKVCVSGRISVSNIVQPPKNRWVGLSATTPRYPLLLLANRCGVSATIPHASAALRINPSQVQQLCIEKEVILSSFPFNLPQIFHLLISEESINIFEVLLDALITKFKHLCCQSIQKISVVRYQYKCTVKAF